MKILYIGGEPLPGQGGGSIHFMEVAAGLAKLGWEVMVCTPAENGLPREEAVEGVKVIRLPMKFKGKTFPVTAISCFNKIRKFNPDILMERYVTFGGSCSILAKMLKKPLVLEVNSPHTAEFIFRYGIKNRLLVKLLTMWSDFQFKSSTKVLSTIASAVPDFARDKFIEVEWAANCDLFDNSSLDNDKRRELKEKLGLSDEPVVVFLGTFRKWHGVCHIPVIAESVINHIPNAKFILIGDGVEKEPVKRQIDEMGISGSIIFTGIVPYFDVPLYLSISSVGIAPYDCDEYPPLKKFGFFWSPLKIFEYMASSLPVVTIDIAPLNRVVSDGERGYVVTEGNWGIFSDKIIKLLKNKQDCCIMGNSARVFVSEKYTWKTHVAGLNSILLNLINCESKNGKKNHI